MISLDLASPLHNATGGAAGARARARAARLGLTRIAPVRPASSPEGLVAPEHRLTRLVAFLAHRREVDLAVDERPAVPARSGASLGSHPLARAYGAVARQARRLGLDPVSYTHLTLPTIYTV